MLPLEEFIRAEKLWRIRRFASEEQHAEGVLMLDEAAREMCGVPAITEFRGNVLLNEGINELWTIVCSAASGTKFDNSNAYLGVGDSATAEAASQTGLQAATNKLYKAMDGGYPTFGTSQLATWRSTFGSSEANFAWEEFTVANGNSDAAVNLNRKTSSQGTKISGQVWELSLQITLS